MPKPLISAIICTKDRYQDLENSLKSLADQDFDKDKYEIIVVDNASQDDTKKLVDKYLHIQAPRIKHIIENQIGLSFARNAGLKYSEADIVAFIDDDAVADKKWLKNLLKAYDEYDADVVGGKILPLGYTDMPKWLPDEIAYFVTGRFDLGDKYLLLKDKCYPVGANMSFKKKIFDKIGLFNTSIGRKDNLLLSRDETDICCKVRREGGMIYYSPDAVIHHKLHLSRLNKNWLRNRLYQEGISEAIIDLHERGVKFGLIIAIKKILHVMYYMLKYLVYRLGYISGNDEKRIILLECKIIRCAGYITQTLKQVMTLQIFMHKNG
ncbi:MAG: glycosyltransferase [Candidatus Omnitrophota bacterium]